MDVPKKRHISLKDLATELGISISTVSRALNDHPKISIEVKERVKKLADEWGYSPNPLAMGLLRQNTRIIGVIVPDLVTHFYSSIISGIESYARERGYYIIISSSYESYEKERESMDNLLKSRVEGLIVCLSQESCDYTHFEKLVDRRIPMVFFDRVCLSDRVSSVVADGHDAAQKITRHFGESGYQRIAFISGPPSLNISKERKAGYLDGLKSLGLEYREDYLLSCEMNADSAAEAAGKLLSLPEPPDAIFGINDTVAFAAMKEIRKRSLRIPEDVGLVGFTDEYHASVVSPSLSSVSHPTFEMGQEAARLFFEALEEKPPRQVKLKTSLVVRESSSGKG